MRTAAGSDINAGLLVQPPPRPPQLVSHRPGFFHHDAVRLEDRVDVAGRPPRVVRQSHGGATEDVHIGGQAAPGQPVTEPPEGLSKRLPVKKRIIRAHATSSSFAATYTPGGETPPARAPLRPPARTGN